MARSMSRVKKKDFRRISPGKGAPHCLGVTARSCPLLSTAAEQYQHRHDLRGTGRIDAGVSAVDAMNLDGGGSSTMVVRDST